MLKSALLIFISCLSSLAFGASPKETVADDVKITILSDMVTSYMGDTSTHAEWGFAALVEVKYGETWKRLLFDTGAHRKTVLQNAKAMGINLCDIETVILSHNHADHTMGLADLRDKCRKQNRHAFKTAIVGSSEIFWRRPLANGSDDNWLLEKGIKKKFERMGGRFVIASTNGQPTALQEFPGLWVTGKIPRLNDEKTYPGDPAMIDDQGQPQVDTVPEDQALVINTAKGNVVLVGCAHAGIINTLSYAQTMGAKKIYALIGGFHLFGKSRGSPTEVATLDWFAGQMATFQISHILGAHCTGFERVAFLREQMHMTNKTAVVSTINSVFSLNDGIIPAELNAPAE